MSIRAEMLRIIHYIAILGTVCVTAGQHSSAQERQPDLDVTTLDRPIETDNPEGGSEVIRGSASGSTLPASPLVVRLIRVEPQSCVLGEQIVYDVELRNGGSRELLLPWTVDRREKGVATNGFWPVLSLALEFREGQARGVLDAGERLFGNIHNAFSVRRVQPGQSVVIRADGVCAYLDSTTSTKKDGVRNLQAVARVGLDYGESALGPSKVSDNFVTLTTMTAEAAAR